MAYREAPPQRIHFLADGRLRRPFIYALVGEKDRTTYKTVYREDRTRPYPIRLFVRGYGYKLFGLFATDRHLFGTGVDEVPVHLFGADPWAVTYCRAPCTERRSRSPSGWSGWRSVSSSAF